VEERTDVRRTGDLFTERRCIRMVAVKPMAAIAQKYVTRAQAAQGDYQSGVAGTPPGAWESATSGAADAFAAGVTTAVAQGRFQKGVVGKGSKWARNAAGKGPARYAQGVAGASADYSAGFQKYHDILAGITLSPRGPRGAPQNQARSNAVGTAQHMARVGS